MIALNVPLVTWCVIAFAMIALIIVRACQKNYNTSRHHGHLFEVGSEREEFFVPGDRLIKDDDLYDDED